MFDIKNDAREITESGRATAQLVRATSEANYTSILESSRADGLKEAFATMGVTGQDYKNSMDYLRTLRGKDNAHLTVDFQQRIAGKLG